jgi:hypothetical protein
LSSTDPVKLLSKREIEGIKKTPRTRINKNPPSFNRPQVEIVSGT